MTPASPGGGRGGGLAEPSPPQNSPPKTQSYPSAVSPTHRSSIGCLLQGPTWTTGSAASPPCHGGTLPLLGEPCPVSSISAQGSRSRPTPNAAVSHQRGCRGCMLTPTLGRCQCLQRVMLRGPEEPKSVPTQVPGGLPPSPGRCPAHRCGCSRPARRRSGRAGG